MEGAGGELHKFAELALRLEMSQDDLSRLKVIWGDEFLAYLQQIAHLRCSFSFRLLDGSLVEYWRATRLWWDNIEGVFPQLAERPIYFISSNTHSVTNLLSGFALKFQKEVVAYLKSEWRPRFAKGMA